MTIFRLFRAKSLLLIGIGLATPAHAGPVIAPGDVGLRHEIQLLAAP
jgi:hypothetical protein